MSLYNNNQVTLKEAINKLLDAYKLKGKMKSIEIVNQWAKLMGPMIANHTKDIYLNNDVLYIKFDSSPLKQEMLMMKSKLIKRLNDHFGEELIRDIKVL